jgi:ribosome-associated translation inhibitor RaiA
MFSKQKHCVDRSIKMTKIEEWLKNVVGHEITISRSREIKGEFCVRLQGKCGYESIYGKGDALTIEDSFSAASKDFNTNMDKYKEKRKIELKEQIIYLKEVLESL